MEKCTEFKINKYFHLLCSHFNSLDINSSVIRMVLLIKHQLFSGWVCCKHWYSIRNLFHNFYEFFCKADLRNRSIKIYALRFNFTFYKYIIATLHFTNSYIHWIPNSTFKIFWRNPFHINNISLVILFFSWRYFRCNHI